MGRLVIAGAEPATARAVALLLHGRGQTPDYMCGAVLSRLRMADMHAILPAAPGDSWYDARAVDPLTEATEAQLGAALDLVEEADAAARRACPGRPLILIGFSQGGCLAVEHLMRGGRADAAAMLTGCRVGAADDELPRADLAGMPAYCSNGDADPWIPTWAFQRAVGDLIASGARVRSDVLPGRDHEISDDEIRAVDALCTAVADAAAPFS